MFPVLVALVLLVACCGAIYLILRNMGQDGIEVAAPGSCKSGRCGVRCTAPTESAETVDASEATLMPGDDSPQRGEPR